MIVKVKQIKKTQQWSGYEGAIYKNCKHSISPFYNQYSQIITGLDEDDEKRLGEILDRDLRSTSPFWHDFRVIMTEKDLILNTDKPEDELKYKLLKAHYSVANSENDLNPRAIFVIYNEEEEAKGINSSASIEIKAFTLLSKLTKEQKKDILRLYPSYTKTDNVADSIVDARLYEEMKKSPSKFVKLVEDKKRDMKIMLKDLVSNRILRKNKNAYYYGEDALGHDEESTITYLDDPANQSLKIVLMQELKSKDK